MTSEEESCRRKLIENKKILDEICLTLRSSNRDVKLASVTCFQSLLRADKMLKSILFETGDFHKELQNIFLTADKDFDI